MSRSKQPLIRQPIPKLPKGTAAIGKEGLVKRSFDGWQGDIVRLTRGESLDIAIEFTQPVQDAKVVCYTNLNRAGGSWRSLPFTSSGGTFRFSLTAKRCGRFGFRVKYSFDDGKTWIWDRVPLASVHVDPEAMGDIRMYTLIPKVTGTTDDWIAELDRIAGMGFNMVHLLPVTEMNGSKSPYSAKDLFTLDPAYFDTARDADGMDAFERFVEAAASRGIGLCIDLVVNHIGPGSLMGQRAPDWIMPDKAERDGMKRSGCWHMNEWLKWGDLVKIHYDHPNRETKEAVWAYMRAYALFWANYAAHTGGMVRLDNLHNSDEAFVAYILRELRQAFPNLVVHAEFFSDANTVLKRAREWDLNLFLANPWEYPYAENLREYLRYLHEMAGSVAFHVPVTTHDTGAPVELFGDTRALVPRYFITALMGLGRTGMVQGNENGLPEKVDFIGPPGVLPGEPDPWMVHHIARINQLLASSDALRTPGNITFIDDNHGAVVAAHRSSKNGEEDLLLFANLDTENPHYIDVDLSALTGHSRHRLENAFDDEPPFPAGAEQRFAIPPCGIKALRLYVE